MWSYSNLVSAEWRVSHVTPKATFQLKFTGTVLTFIEHVQCSDCVPLYRPHQHFAQVARTHARSLTKTKLTYCDLPFDGPDGSVRIATRYGLDQ